MQIISEIEKLIEHLEKKEYKGFDPYDALNMPLPWSKFGRIIPVLFIQLLKRLPLNIRPLIGIKPGYNPKAMGLFLHAFCILYKKTGNKLYLQKADFFFNWLFENVSSEFEGKSWGYNFLWISPIRNLPANTPSAVVTAFISRAIFNYYKITSDSRAQDILFGASEFVLRSLPVHEDESGINFSYTPLQEEICYNASLLATEILAYRYFFDPTLELKNKIDKAVSFIIERQKDDGSWAYSENPETKSERNQIDFHQGFILESLEIILQLIPEKEALLKPVIKKGLSFYRNNQFSDRGRPFYRLPKHFPTDIHHVSQGILTFSRLADYDESYRDHSVHIANWAVNNMFSRKGFFYYRKGKLFTNKIDYIRWGQAWMLLALAEIL